MSRPIKSTVVVLSPEQRAERQEALKARQAEAEAAGPPTSPFTSTPQARMWRLNPECRFWRVPA